MPAPGYSRKHWEHRAGVHGESRGAVPSDNVVEMHDRSVNVRLARLERIATDMGRILEDHESRMRWGERLLMYGAGTLGVGGFLLNLFTSLKH